MALTPSSSLKSTLMASDLIYLSVLYQVGGEGWCVGGKPPYSMQVAAYKKEQDAVIASCQARGGAARSLVSGAPRSPNHGMSFNNGNFLSKVQDSQWPSAPVISSRPSSSTSDVHPVLRAAAANAKQLRCLALISHNNMKPAMQARQDLLL